MSARNLLDQIQVNTPCSADWDAMLGNDQVRFCEHCNLSVHNLSHMTRKRALHLVRVSKGRLCVRYYRDPNGALITGALPQKLHSIGRRASKIAAGAFTATLSLSGTVAHASPDTGGFSGFDNVLTVEQSQASANSAYLGASIAGTVSNAHGAVIVGATVALSNPQANLALLVPSNHEGQFRFDNLEAGTYSLRIEAPGFNASEITGITLQSETTQTFNQMLEVAGIQEEVEISSGSDEFAGVTSGAMVMVEPSEPLVKAAFEEDLQAVEALLTPKNVNLRDKTTNATALEHAVRNGHREMVQSLIRAGADINSVNASGETC
jgi:carboxypeptidase family protein/ankyrin repeat protein